MSWVNDYLNYLDSVVDGVAFQSAQPFPHIVIDNFLKYEIARDLFDKFPDASHEWYKYENVFELKRAQDDLSKIPQEHAFILMLLNTRVFIEYLETVTGIKGLIPDPWFRGGGLHQIYPKGKLDVHADFNVHHHLKLNRRLNALLYLNFNWREEWGGHLELWDKGMQGCQIKISPKFNRLVIFETNDDSYHGHPNPLDCPPGVTRKSMAWYYYTSPQESERVSHSTLFKKRPEDETTEEIEKLREERGKGRIK